MNPSNTPPGTEPAMDSNVVQMVTMIIVIVLLALAVVGRWR